MSDSVEKPSPSGDHGSRASDPPRRRHRRGEGGQLRDELLDAATELLLELGSHEPASLRAIARRAGVTPTAVYLQFADRDDLILAVLERLFAELAAERDAAEEEAAHEGGDDLQRLRARSHAYVDWGIAQPGAYQVLYEGRAVPRLSDPSELTFGQAMLDRTEVLVERLVAANAARPSVDPARASLLLWTSLHGIVSLKINKDTIPWPPARELVDEILTALLAPRRG